MSVWWKHVKRDKSWLQDDKLYIIDFKEPRNLKVYKKIIRPELKKQTLNTLVDLYQDTRRFDIMLGEELKKYDVSVVRTINITMYDYPKDCITAEQKKYYRKTQRRRGDKKKRNNRGKKKRA